MSAKKINPFVFTFSIFAALMLTMSFADPTVGIEYRNVFSSITDNLRRSFSGTGIVSTVLFIVFYYVGIKRFSYKLRYKKTIGFFSAFIAVCWLISTSFYINNTLHPIVESSGQLVKSVIYVCGAFYIIYEASAIFDHLLEDRSNPSGSFHNDHPSNCLGRFITAHKKITIASGLLLFWIFPLIISYPANMCPDSWTQLTQYWGYATFTSHHPPFHTVVIGLFTRLGAAVGNPDHGLFLMVIIQAFIFAAVIAYSFDLMDRLNAPSWLQLISFFTAALSPYYVTYVTVVLKDVPYSISAMLFTIELIYVLIDHSSFISSRKHIFLAFISTVGTILFRNNGKYIVYPTLLVLLIILIIKHKLFGKKICIKAALLIIVSVAAAFAINTGITRICNIERGSIKEALSFPYQQTARTVKEHADEITDKEIESIDRVLDYEKLAENYLPTISDPVKALMRQDATTEDLINYLITWGKMFFKYPKSYFSATFNQNYGLIYPFQKCDTFYFSYALNEERHLPLAEYPGFTGSTRFESVKEFLSGWYRFLFSAPLIGLLSHPAFYTLIIFLTMLLAICLKKIRYLIACTPLFFSIIVVILAPCLFGHPRYMFPVIYSMPTLLAYYNFILKRAQHPSN